MSGKNDFFRVAFCLPDINALDQVTSGHLTDASYIQQEYIAAGLRHHGYPVTFLAPRQQSEVVYTRNLIERSVATRTWSATRLFKIASKGSWRVQRLLGIPYLNVFSNYALMDGYLQSLPGNDVVHERNNLYRVGVAMACRRLGLPYVLFFDADEILEYDFMGRPIKGLLRWRAKSIISYNLRIADCVICVSTQAKTHLIRNWDVPEEKIVVFPNGVDVERFRPYPESRAHVRASLGADTNPLIMFLGNFYEWHDVATLQDAFAQILPAFPNARLVLIGDGSQRPAMMRRADDVGITHAVHFTGLVPHSEVPRLLDAADIAVAPYPATRQDLWVSPMKLFEYMAAGKTLVASAVGQIAEVISDGYNGLLVRPGDPTALATALERLLNDSALCSRLGLQAREDAVREYSWERYVSRLECLYAAVIARRPVNTI